MKKIVCAFVLVAAGSFAEDCRLVRVYSGGQTWVQYVPVEPVYVAPVIVQTVYSPVIYEDGYDRTIRRVDRVLDITSNALYIRSQIRDTDHGYSHHGYIHHGGRHH